jgi:predicted O-methyltransferase YrrM
MPDDITAIERALFGNVLDTFDVDRIAALAASIDSANYATAHMAQAERHPHNFSLIESALKRVTFDGLYLEFGVFRGNSINRIAKMVPERTIYGFDSFSGLPEDWMDAPKGSFAVPGPPAKEENVEFVIGWFDSTLPGFCHSKGETPVAFVHIDCDLYSSTQTIFAQLKSKIVPGTVIVFDEYFNYPGWRQHEWLAFKEYIAHSGRTYRYLGLVPVHKQVSVIITS